MAWRGRAVALKCSVDTFRTYLGRLNFSSWRPAGMTLHNTASPNRKRWDAYPGETWMRNLKDYYQGLGWNAGPHAFVDGNDIWVMTDFNVRGTHSPSYNGTRLGIEMVADFDVEDDDTGIGLRVKTQTAQLFAVCHAQFGWEPSNTSIVLHKEDPATDHACPGKDISKAEFLRLVTSYMGEGGGHDPHPGDPDGRPPAPWNIPGVVNTPGDTLNMREGSSPSAGIIRALPHQSNVLIFNEAFNGSTKWLNVQAFGEQGWVHARFVTYDDGLDGWIRVNDVTATVFGGLDETQLSAYPPEHYVDPNAIICSLPYKWRGARRPKVKIRGPGGEVTAAVDDVGPWNIADGFFCLQGGRPLVEKQFRDQTMAQNNRVPVNDAGIDLSPATAEAVGISGKGKVDVEIEIVG